MTAKVSGELAKEIKQRAEERCEYCHVPQAVIGQAFHLEHIIPRSRGGQNKLNNLVFSCAHCNLAKSKKARAIDPLTKKTTRLFHPRKNIWAEHFRWNNDFTRLIGRTAIGRATIIALNMNDELLQKARHHWFVLNKIP